MSYNITWCLQQICWGDNHELKEKTRASFGRAFIATHIVDNFLFAGLLAIGIASLYSGSIPLSPSASWALIGSGSVGFFICMSRNIPLIKRACSSNKYASSDGLTKK